MFLTRFNKKIIKINIIALIIFNLFDNTFSMHKLPYPELNNEQKNILFKKLQMETMKLVLETTPETFLKACHLENPQIQDYILKKSAIIKDNKKNLLSIAIFYDIEEWFSQANLTFISDIINEPILGFKPIVIKTLTIDPDHESIYFGIPLLRAIKLKRINIAIKMICRGFVNINIKNSCTNQTPLHYAAITGSPALVRLLLLQGSASNSQDHLLNLPINYAIQIVQKWDLSKEELENTKAIIKMLKAANSKWA